MMRLPVNPSVPMGSSPPGRSGLHRALLLCSLLLMPAVVWADSKATPTSRPGALPGTGDIPVITKGPTITLEQALGQADRRNLTLTAAKQEIAGARSRLKASWSALIPSVGGSLSFTHNDHADAADMMGQQVEMRRQQDLRGSVQVNVPLINPRAWHGVGLSRLDLEISKLSVESARQALLLSVSQAYFQALTARSLIQIQQGQMEAAQRHLKVTEIRYRSGTGQRLDLVRARTEVIAAHEELLRGHTALENARDALGLLVGQRRADQLPMPAPAPRLTSSGESARALEARARSRREDIRLSRKLVTLADKQVTAAWMQFLPSLNGSWQLSYQLSDPASFGDPDRSRWLIGLSLSVPLYSQTRYADLAGRRAAREKARLEARATELSASLAVRQALRARDQAEDLARTAASRAELAAETLTLAEAAYASGTGSSLAVTDARRSGRAAATDAAIRTLQTQLAQLELHRATGGDMTRLK